MLLRNFSRRIASVLEQYISRHEVFGSSLEPVEPLPDAPEVALRMAAAARAADVGPMAAVAGTMAQLAAEAAMAAGDTEAIVENGGDMYLLSDSPVVVGLFAGEASMADKLAMLIEPDHMPLAVCSSSSFMGHSMSLGKCDLAAVTASQAAIADAAATRAANLVKETADIDPTLECILQIEGVQGVLLAKDDRVGLTGQLPRLEPNHDADLSLKITRSDGLSS